MMQFYHNCFVHNCGRGRTGDAIVGGKPESRMHDARPSASQAACVGGARAKLTWLLSLSSRRVPAGGIMISGPPGSGKSTLVRDVVAALRYRLVSLGPRALSSDSAGAVEMSIAHAFADAAAAFAPEDLGTAPVPAVVLIDDLDVWAPSHARSVSDGRLVAALDDALAALQCEPAPCVAFVATASYPDLVHPALLTPDRISHHIRLKSLTPLERSDFLRSKVPHGSDEALVVKLAAMTPGFVPADMVKLFAEADHVARRRQSETVEATDLERAVSAVRPMLLASAGSAWRSLSAPLATPVSQTLYGLDGAQQTIRDCLNAVFLRRTLAEDNPNAQQACLALEELGSFRGLIIHGPSGCGKSALARAAVGMLPPHTLNAMYIDSTSIVSSVIGEAERAVAKLFALARASAPTLLLIENIDMLAPRRSSLSMGGDGGSSNEAFERLLSTFLVQVDGVQIHDPGSPGVFVIATTRSLEALDPAILRPGRFEVHVAVSPPDALARTQMLRSVIMSILPPHARDALFKDESWLQIVAERTNGWTAPDMFALFREVLLNIVRELPTETARSGWADSVSGSLFVEALGR